MSLKKDKFLLTHIWNPFIRLKGFDVHSQLNTPVEASIERKGKYITFTANNQEVFRDFLPFLFLILT